MTSKNNEWAKDEFGDAVLGDKRLTERLVNIADSLASLPESSINQACGSWSEAKAAYRFFQNENVKESGILASHVAKTSERTKAHKRVLVIQDTSYISYTHHKKTSGLGDISRKRGDSQPKGIIMHTAFAVSTEGLALGILDQKIYLRPTLSEEDKSQAKKNDTVHIEDKESIKWIETLKKTSGSMDSSKTEAITVCDREADMYDFFELAHSLNSAVLVRACQNRVVNRKYRCPRKGEQKLWEVIKSSPCAGVIEVEVPAKDNRSKRTAYLEVRFGRFMLNPSKNNIRHRTEKLPNLLSYAVYVAEKDPLPGTDLLEWMLLTNLQVNTFDEAIEKVSWYCLRWKIEIFHKILKSGLKVEECRLGTAERLMRYLTVMSVIAWRILFITSIARTDPTLPCIALLAEEEWKVLYIKIHKKPCPNIAPTIKEAVSWIAQLGGYLARRSDLEPGPSALWKGWKRLFDLADGWRLAHESNIYG